MCKAACKILWKRKLLLPLTWSERILYQLKLTKFTLLHVKVKAKGRFPRSVNDNEVHDEGRLYSNKKFTNKYFERSFSLEFTHLQSEVSNLNLISWRKLQGNNPCHLSSIPGHTLTLRSRLSTSQWNKVIVKQQIQWESHLGCVGFNANDKCSRQRIEKNYSKL